MSLLDKLGQVADLAKSEYQRHFGEEDRAGIDGALVPAVAQNEVLAPAVKTPEQAYERLELPVDASLDEVRARYQEVVRAWHPRAQQGGAEAERAHQELAGYLDALEMLEEHLLPLP